MTDQSLGDLRKPENRSCRSNLQCSVSLLPPIRKLIFVIERQIQPSTSLPKRTSELSSWRCICQDRHHRHHYHHPRHIFSVRSIRFWWELWDVRFCLRSTIGLRTAVYPDVGFRKTIRLWQYSSFYICLRNVCSHLSFRVDPCPHLCIRHYGAHFSVWQYDRS